MVLSWGDSPAPPYHILDIPLDREDANIAFATRTPEGKVIQRRYGLLFNMRYRKERGFFDGNIASSEEVNGRLSCHVNDALVTKDASWAYENEQRILIPMKEEGKFVSCFHPYLTGIILGIKCPKDEEIVNKIADLFQEEGDEPLRVYQARYSEKTFDVLVPGLDQAE